MDFLDISFLSAYCLPVVIGLCLLTGLVVKLWVNDVDNKWIPTIVTIEGVLLSMWINRGISPEILLGGALSGWVSTGLHQWFKQTFTPKSTK